MIRNGVIFERSALRRAASDILEAGLSALDTFRAARERVVVRDDAVCIDGAETLRFCSGGLYVIALGKCAVPAARALEEVLGEHLTGGIVLGIDETATFGTLRYFRGTHPFPSEANKIAAEAIVTLLDGLGEGDRVLFIVSGGASTLLYDSDEFSPDEEARMLATLFKAGATIEEINTLRKHLSRARGGNLAAHTYPAESVALIFSDVPSNTTQFIASGPTVRDETTREDAERILAKYRVLESCGMKGCSLLETPKDGKYFERVRNMLFVSNILALEAMRKKAEALGFGAEIRDARLTGEAREVGRRIAESLHGAKEHTVLLYGGETTVTLRGDGAGGRNQELVLGALGSLRDGELIAALASDGCDNGAHAGAVGDTLTVQRARELKLDIEECLARNDSYRFFEAAGDAIVTGPTGSNVSDLTVALKR